jgi:prolyl oligopeptidase
LRYQLRQTLDTEWLEALFSVNQLFGLHNRIFITMERMPQSSVRDYENIIARLRAVPAYVTQNIEFLEDAAQHGVVQPRLVAELVVRQLAVQSSQDARTSSLLAAFRRFPSNIPAAEQERLRTQAVGAYEQQFLPAWKKLQAYMSGEYLSKARTGIGLSTMTDGRKAYEISVRASTTTSMTPEEIHKLGEAEVNRIESSMLTIARQTGFNGTLVEFERKLSESPEQLFRSKEEMLAYCRSVAKIIEPELPRLFKNLPRMYYGIRTIPEDRERETASNAQFPKPDGTAPGWFNLNAYAPTKQVRYNKEALVLHEAVPGHIFQGSMAQSVPGLPEFRKFYMSGAYTEGWALYAESLGADLGVYRDPIARFGQLSSERFRAVRLVVDTGMHAMNWTREQAIAYFHAHAPEASLSEIDRYIAWPGQALSYKIGELKIKQLRREAEAAQGEKFDIREFHDAILRNGALPLEMIRIAQ